MVKSAWVRHAKTMRMALIMHYKASTVICLCYVGDYVHPDKTDIPLIDRVYFWQIGYGLGGNFNIHIWAWSASPYVQVGRL